jgi:putative endonuclease
LSNPRHRLGLDAEAVAAAHLREQGWTILVGRFRVTEGELDLVCFDPGGSLVGVEVRARRSRRAGAPVETVDRRRLGRLRSALARFAVETRPGWREMRIDLVTLERRDGSWVLDHHERIDGW